jgi:hypothetical protein
LSDFADKEDMLVTADDVRFWPKADIGWLLDGDLCIDADVNRYDGIGPNVRISHRTDALFRRDTRAAEVSQWPFAICHLLFSLPKWRFTN